MIAFVCLALERYLVTWEVLFSRRLLLQGIHQKDKWQRGVGSYFPCPVPSLALTSCSVIYVLLLSEATLPEAARNIF